MGAVTVSVLGSEIPAQDVIITLHDPDPLPELTGQELIDWLEGADGELWRRDAIRGVRHHALIEDYEVLPDCQIYSPGSRAWAEHPSGCLDGPMDWRADDEGWMYVGERIPTGGDPLYTDEYLARFACDASQSGVRSKTQG